MKLLIIENSSIPKKKGKHYTNSLNGLFIDELVVLRNNLYYFQFESNNENNISSYELESHGVECSFASIKKNKLWNYLNAYYQAIKVIKAADFVYLYYPNSFKFLSFVCRVYGKKYGLYIRGMKGLTDIISRHIYRHAYAIFTVSDYFTNMVNGFTRKTVAHTIRPMIPYTDADVVTDRNYYLKDFYNILFLGRIDKDKGLKELIQASKSLREKGFGFKLKIVGDGDFLPELEHIIDELKIQDIISLEGPVYNNNIKANYYKQSDLYVLPTYHEGFPRTIYEAMIFGTPIVTTFVGGIPALMKDRENSLKIEPKSVNSIVDVLTYAFEHYDKMCILAKNARETVRPIIDHNRLTHAQLLNQIINPINKAHE